MNDLSIHDQNTLCVDGFFASAPVTIITDGILEHNALLLALP